MQECSRHVTLAGVSVPGVVPMLVALVIVASVALVVVAAMSGWASYLARRSSEETRAQMHSALIDERTGWLAERASWQDERRMLLDRLSDREGRQISVLQPTRPEVTVETAAPVKWDRDLEPFDFERHLAEEEGAAPESAA